MVLKTGQNEFGTRAGIKLTLAISIAFHIAALAIIHKALPLKWVTQSLRTYEIELIRPPVDTFADKNTPKATVTHEQKQEKNDSEPVEETISLDTKDVRYSAYAEVIKEKIARHWRYPPEAMEKLLEGTLLLVFTLYGNGGLTGIRVPEPSEVTVINKAAVRAIQDAAPFPSFPGSVTVKRLHIRAAFDYRLTSER